MSGLAAYIDKDHRDAYKLFVKILVSLTVIFGCGWVVFFSSTSTENDKRLAAGFLGSAIGYWIK